MMPEDEFIKIDEYVLRVKSIHAFAYVNGYLNLAVSSVGRDIEIEMSEERYKEFERMIASSYCRNRIIELGKGVK